MKLFAALMLLGLNMLLYAGSASGAGEFGLELGDDIDRYRHEQQAEHTVERFCMYEVSPETPHPDFDTYAVDTYDGKIIRIMASSPDDYSKTGEKTLAVYKKIRDYLKKKYGEPAFVFSDVEDAGEELQEYLVMNDGVEVMEWTFGSGTEEPGSVYVYLAGVENEKGEYATYCTVYTESRDYQGIADRMRQMTLKENGVPSDGEGEPEGWEMPEWEVREPTARD